MNAAAFAIKSRYVALIRWSSRGSCGNAGCRDKECGCALCGESIGVNEFDPRWDGHSEFCGGCEVCRDSVPLILFRGEGNAMQQAQFHQACFEKIVFVRSRASDGEH